MRSRGSSLPLGTISGSLLSTSRSTHLCFRRSSFGEERPSELPAIYRWPPVVQSAQFGDHRQPRRRGRSHYRNRGRTSSPTTYKSSNSVCDVSLPSSGSACASSGRCSCLAARGETAECAAEHSLGVGGGELVCVGEAIAGSCPAQRQKGIAREMHAFRRDAGLSRVCA